MDNSTTAHRLNNSTGNLQFPDHITVMETEEAIHIIRKPNEKTVKKEIQPPIIKRATPALFLTKRVEEIDKPKIILPPSKCDLTIDERFTTILCQIQKKEIDPGLYDLQCPSTIIGKLQRVNAKAARLSNAPYSNPRKPTNPKEAKVTDRLGTFGKEEDLDWDNLMADKTLNNRGCWFFEMFNHPNNYNTGPSKSLDELDDEIEQYFNKVGGRGKRVFKRKTYEMLLAEMKARYGMEDPFFKELEAKISSLKLDNTADEETEDQQGDVVVEPAVIKGQNFFKTFVKAIKSSKIRPKREEEGALDEDLGSYWSKNETKSKQNLDDDLESYRKKDPRNLKNNDKSNRSIKNPITGPSTTVTASTSSKTTGDDYMNVDDEEDIFAEWLQ